MPRESHSSAPSARDAIRVALVAEFDPFIADAEVFCHRLLCVFTTWLRPPGWTAAAWAETVAQVAAVTALEALKAFDPQRGCPLAGFVFQRVRHAVRECARKERSYGRHCPLPRHADPPAVTARYPTEAVHALLAAMQSLSPADQLMLQRLFWEGETEAAVAHALGLSQQAVSKRRTMAHKRLRRLLEEI